MAGVQEPTTDKYRFIILGGCGFIGRHLVDFLVTNRYASKIRVVDKVPPQMAWLNKYHQDLFSNPIVEFKSANLINPESCVNVFCDDEGKYDFVINLAAETKQGQADQVYREGIEKLSYNCAKEAAKQHVHRYIEISDGHIYSSEKIPVEETVRPEPWTMMARHKLQVEESLASLEGLEYVVLRPAVVYGVGDKQGIVPRLVIGAVYKHLGEVMKLLWHSGIKMHTVHALDMCRAIWHVCFHGKSGDIYNVVDNGDTTQGKISAIVSEIFNINHEYLGSAMSAIAKMDIRSLVEEINDKHSGPWADLCNNEAIEYTPLTPFLNQELLYDKHLNLDGSKLRGTGFSFLIPSLTKDKVQEILNDYIAMGIFPRSVVA